MVEKKSAAKKSGAKKTVAKKAPAKKAAAKKGPAKKAPAKKAPAKKGSKGSTKTTKRAEIRIIPDIVKGAVKNGTGEKPQHKLWFCDSNWWLVLPMGGATYLWRLNEESGWKQSSQILELGQVKADVVAKDGLAHVLAVPTGRSACTLVSLEYSAPDRAYRPWPLRPKPVDIELSASGVETATLALDGTSRMWISTVVAGAVLVRSSAPPYDTWSAPTTLATNLDPDDISTVLGRPDGSVIVAWSDQRTRSFAARLWYPGQQEWQQIERYSDGSRVADDHLNGVVGTNGAVFIAVKTSRKSKKPTIALLWRDPQGRWSLRPVWNSGTRPVAVLDEKAKKIHVLFASSESGGDILIQSAKASDPVFKGEPTIVIARGSYREWNNPTVASGPVQGSFVVASCRDGGFRVRSALVRGA